MRASSDILNIRFFCSTLAQLGSTLVAVTLSMNKSWKNATCWHTVHSTDIVGCCSSKTTRGEDGLADVVELPGDETVEVGLPDFDRRGKLDNPVDDDPANDANLLDLGEEIGVVMEFVDVLMGMGGGEVGEGGVARPEDRNLLNI